MYKKQNDNYLIEKIAEDNKPKPRDRPPQVQSQGNQKPWNREQPKNNSPKKSSQNRPDRNKDRNRPNQGKQENPIWDTVRSINQEKLETLQDKVSAVLDKPIAPKADVAPSIPIEEQPKQNNDAPQVVSPGEVRSL
jgi:hypothetical protein